MAWEEEEEEEEKEETGKRSIPRKHLGFHRYRFFSPPRINLNFTLRKGDCKIFVPY